MRGTHCNKPRNQWFSVPERNRIAVQEPSDIGVYEVRVPNVTKESPVIRVAIVCGPETTVLAESLEALLAEAKEFTFRRF